MKKGKSRHKRKKSRLLWIVIAVIGMAAITAAVCVAGMFKKEDVWKTPEELLVEYMNHIPAQEYENKLIWDDSLIFPNLASNIIKPYLVYQNEVSAEYWISGAFSSETASRVLEGTKKVVNDSHGTG